VPACGYFNFQGVDTLYRVSFVESLFDQSKNIAKKKMKKVEHLIFSLSLHARSEKQTHETLLLPFYRLSLPISDRHRSG
jgi:hypothetical protein